jgi:hypothetical protein
MNKNIVLIGGIILVATVAGFVYFIGNDQGTAPDIATSTVSTSTDTDQVNQPVTGETRTPGVPSVTTGATVAPTDTTAVVTGSVVPNGAITSYWHEFGTTQNLGSKTSVQVVGSGYAQIPTPAYITGLAKNTTYYFRLVAENQYGRVAGAQNTVTTTQNKPAPVGGLPISRTLAANTMTQTSASLTGEVNPNRASTQYWFEYGKNGNLGNTTPLVSVGNGSANVSATASVSNLESGTTYYFRINAQNQFGTVNGTIQTFKTAAPTASAPVVTTQVPAFATTTATVRGTVNPYGSQTTYWFEYSTDSSFGSASLKTTPHRSAGAVMNTVSVQASVTGLSSNTTYYVRTVAQNAQGTVRGDTLSFKTK